MNKEAFLKKIDEELEKAKIEYEKQKNYANYYEKIDEVNYDDFDLGVIKDQNDEFLNAKYLSKLYLKRIEMLEYFKKYPDYIKIQEMSNEEVEECQQKTLKDLNERIKQCEKNVAQQINELELRKKELIEQLKNAAGREEEKIIIEGREIENKLNDLRSSNNKYYLEKFELENKQKKIEKMTTVEFRKELLREIDLNKEFNYINGEIDDFDLLINKVAMDPEKARKMCNLLSRYANDTSFLKETIDLNTLPNTSKIVEMEKILKRIYPLYEDRNKDFLNYFNQFKENFNDCYQSFQKYFDIKALFYLIYKNAYEVYGKNIGDYEKYYKLYDDMIKSIDENIQQIIELVKRNRFFKTKKINDKIQKEQELIRCKVFESLQLELQKYSDVFGLEDVSNYFYKKDLNNEYNDQYVDYEELCKKIKRIFSCIEKRYEMISCVKTELSTTFELGKKWANDSRKEIPEIRNEIIALGEDNFKDKDISIISVSNDYSQNEEYIITTFNQVYLYELIYKYYKKDFLAKNKQDMDKKIKLLKYFYLHDGLFYDRNVLQELGFSDEDIRNTRDLKKLRNGKEDFSLMFNCSEEQIATTQEQLFKDPWKYVCLLNDINTNEKMVDFPRLKFVRGVYCDSLISVEGLKNLKYIRGTAVFSSLTNLNGLNNLEKIYGDAHFESLTNLQGLNNLKCIGRDAHFEKLTSLQGICLNSLEEIRGDAHFGSLTSLNGLESLKYIDGDAHFESLDSLHFLKSLKYIGGDAHFESLIGLEGICLNSLEEIRGDAHFESLTSLEGLENIKIHGKLYLNSKLKREYLRQNVRSFSDFSDYSKNVKTSKK